MCSFQAGQVESGLGGGQSFGWSTSCLVAETATRGTEGWNSQLERAEGRAERAGERTGRTGCQAVCTSFRYRWAEKCIDIWEDFSKHERTPKRHGIRKRRRNWVCVHVSLSTSVMPAALFQV